ncbi:zinc finger protein 3-like [Penaeus monodon]|uniref:zinc finger protein 3-like n=1 Tax=Penaeus monodon TaxID=6687 RepID=UPI0018A6D6A2|nr:zinc finger protein 3-like [Penaeus monodon]
MSFLGDGMPSAILTGKEIVGIGVGVKEELSEDVTEDTCLEIKEELLEYGDEARNYVCNMNMIHESRFLHNLPDLRHEANAKDLCNLVQDCNDMSKVSFGAKDCGKKYSSDRAQMMYKERLKESTQLKVESTRKYFACEVCGRELCQENHVSIHMRGHTKEKLYNWEICNKTFPSKSDPEKHVDIHRMGKPYNCGICNTAFPYESSFFNHMIIHTEEKPYSYGLCNKAISQKHNLVKNMKVHTKKKSYSKTFSERSYHVQHIRVHTKEKPYNCEICNKAFTWKRSLQILCGNSYESTYKGETIRM